MAEMDNGKNGPGEKALPRASIRRLALIFIGAVLGAGLLKIVGLERGKQDAVEAAVSNLLRGSPEEIRVAEQRVESYEGDARAYTLLIYARAHLALLGNGQVPEFDASRAFSSCDAAILTTMIAMAQDQQEAARSALEDTSVCYAEAALLPGHRAWLRITLGQGTAEELYKDISGALSGQPESLLYERAKILALCRAARVQDALNELMALRARHRNHAGLWIEELLLLSQLRHDLPKIAAQINKILEKPSEALSEHDKARLWLARGVVHAAMGEREEALSTLAKTQRELPRWDYFGQAILLEALFMSADVEAANKTLLSAWLPSEQEGHVFAAWGQFISGDYLNSLETLAHLPQEHPRVSYLQGLALVEQQRFGDADPWIERAEYFFPKQIELQIARLRVQAHNDSPERIPEIAKMLKALAEEEPYAPRAWTGLGEALLLVKPTDPQEVEKAFLQATAHEFHPAEAYLQLAQIGEKFRGPHQGHKHLAYLENATRANPHFPRYRRALALAYWNWGNFAEAQALLEGLQGNPWPDPEKNLLLAQLYLEDGCGEKQLMPQLLRDIERDFAASEQLAEVQARLALAHCADSSVSAALQGLRPFVEGKYHRPASRVLYARLLERAGDDDEAEHVLRAGIYRSNEKDRPVLYRALSRLEEKHGKRPKAAAYAHHALRGMHQYWYPARDQLATARETGMLWLRVGKPKMALFVARSLTASLPSHPKAWAIRGEFEAENHDCKSARASATQAIQLGLDPKQVSAIFAQTPCSIR